MNNILLSAILKRMQAQQSQMPKPVLKCGIGFVFSHLLSCFNYSEELYKSVHFVDDERVKDLTHDLDMLDYCKIFFGGLSEGFGNGKPIIEVPFNPFNAFLVSMLINFTKQDRTQYHSFVSVAFFHDDESVAERAGPFAKEALDLKAKTLREMADFPFIKKVEIPMDDEITKDYMRELLNEH